MSFLVIVRSVSGEVQQFRADDCVDHEEAVATVRAALPDARTILVRVK